MHCCRFVLSRYSKQAEQSAFLAQLLQFDEPSVRRVAENLKPSGSEPRCGAKLQRVIESLPRQALDRLGLGVAPYVGQLLRHAWSRQGVLGFRSLVVRMAAHHTDVNL